MTPTSHRPHVRRLSVAVVLVAGALLPAGGAVAASSSTSAATALRASAATSPATSPAKPPSTVCTDNLRLGYKERPDGAVAVSTTTNLPDLVNRSPEGTTFWLTSGRHYYGGGTYDQVQPKNGDTFLGQPGAIIDGRHQNRYAFGGHASDVKIAYLTISRFGAPGQNNDEGVVNHDAATGWLMKRLDVRYDAGAGVFLGSSDTVQFSCLRYNGQYGFSSYRPEGVSDLTLDGNEITGNNTDDWEHRRPGCGCTGGGKFWDTDGADVTGNYVHDNRGVGLWADTDNTGFLFSGNYIADNDNEGLFYEISYNASIISNTFVRNALVKGPTNPGFPAGAIYLSESGSDARAGNRFGGVFTIAGNRFYDNYAGVVAWENADRFAGSPNNTSSTYSTLVNPQASVQSCGNASLIGTSPYVDDCRWKTQNLSVHDNVFSLTASRLGGGCTTSRGCGLNGLFSNYGTSPSWSPYKGTVVQAAISSRQNNRFYDNTYRGPWAFMARSQGSVVSLSTWRSAYSQDAGSSMR